MVIASRYAKSLIDLSIENNQLDTVYNDMIFVKEICHSQKDFLNFLRSPIIKTDKKQLILKEVFKNSVSEITLRFFTVLTTKRRESYIDKIAASFIEQYKTRKNILTASVSSALKLDETEKARLIKLLKESATGEVELIEKTNKDLIGGFILKIGDKQIDTSVQRKLNDLKKSFSENPYIPEI